MNALYDNRDKAWFRDVLYDSSGIDVVFWIDKSEQMRESYQSYGAFKVMIFEFVKYFWFKNARFKNVLT